jgi:sulfide:quinone oxidoreductase
MKTHHQIVIISGGNGGISVAAQLLHKRPTLDIAIV